MLRSFFTVRLYSPIANKHVRYSKGFLKSLIDKVKEESNRDAELKENIRKFREETAKLEQSKELQSVREFYRKIEKELPTDAVEKIRVRLNVLSDKLKEGGQQLAMNESLKKSLENLSKAGEQMKDVTKSLGDSEFLKIALKSIEAVEKELESDRAKVYRPPTILKTRMELIGKTEERIIQPDSESSGVVLHKDSKWYGAWQDFKDNNQYVQKFFDLKAQYEESEHLLVRSVRFVTDRLSQLFGGMGSENELQTVLDEIAKTDANFDVESFIRYCRFLVIPNVLEAIVRADLPILKDWCYEAPYNVLATPLKQIQELGLVSDSRVLDVSHVDIQMGKMMEQGPVLVISFQAQQINCIRDKNGAVHEGDPHKVLRVTHVWALCRDQTEFHPWAAWRLLDIAMMPTEQWL
ncbi:Mitochondrial import inner membrane translocase subunit TIM44 [Clonorchis sinensis]|uniref:Mitochondrial import inner membrane translocase subunit TIM44 n=1 Tax=Clonorchis sinensis TaxID=79923 RepID=A0A8T1MTI9_CLOSI|nr:Mitochondrial import inner membrane translocase subunit TIM44 [Clonorchis sinensis]